MKFSFSGLNRDEYDVYVDGRKVANVIEASTGPVGYVRLFESDKRPFRRGFVEVIEVRTGIVSR